MIQSERSKQKPAVAARLRVVLRWFRTWAGRFIWLCRLGPETRRRSGRGVFKQGMDIVRLGRNYSLRPMHYYDWRLYDPDRLPMAGNWLTQPRAEAVFARSASGEVAVLNDKLAFWERCEQAGLAVIPVLARFEAGQAIYPDPKMPRIPTGQSLLAKPRMGGRGEGIHRWLRENGCFKNDQGALLGPDDVKHALTQLSLDTTYLVQPYLENHPEIEPISGGALCAVRIISVLDEQLSPEPVIAMLVMSGGGSFIANFTMPGTLAAPIELTAGTIGAAVNKGNDNRLVTHPRSGARIDGRLLPYWEATVALARRAHHVFPGVLVIGWDIAITPDGPILIEGNARPGLENPQTVHDRSFQDFLDDRGVRSSLLRSA